MARLQLNKSSLARESRALTTYRRFLPSLDLKRQQLMTERAAAERALAETEQRIERCRRRITEGCDMLANTDVDLGGIVTVSGVDIGTENVVGTRLPVLEAVHLERTPYALLAKPHWVDVVIAALGEMLELSIQRQVEQRRLALLDDAVKRITQRVNLFDKVLIPRTRENIKRIRIYLSDEQMAAVVRSKIAKRKRMESTA